MQFGIIGSGSWATALAKILTDNKHCINWWIRNESTINHIAQRSHNPHYLHTAYFNHSLLQMSSSIEFIIEQSEVLIVAVPSAYVNDALGHLRADSLKEKKIVSAIKGLLPATNELLNKYLQRIFNFNLQDYFTVLGPCHAEEVAAEKLSYLTFSGINEGFAGQLARSFNTDYIKTKINHDVIGVQYAAVMKNIYALGAGIAHGLEYGDNFLSVYIANAANEMTAFLKKVTCGLGSGKNETLNYSASVYLGDLLVTCYSLYSRNRMFGNMIGKGYPVKAAQLELNMVAEGYNASKCIHHTNETLQSSIPIAEVIYQILWNHVPAVKAFKEIENFMV